MVETPGPFLARYFRELPAELDRRRRFDPDSRSALRLVLTILLSRQRVQAPPMRPYTASTACLYHGGGIAGPDGLKFVVLRT